MLKKMESLKDKIAGSITEQPKVEVKINKSKKKGK
jgi:hypothetical protein